MERAEDNVENMGLGESASRRRISMNELTTYRWSFEEDVQHYRAAGLEALSIWRHKLSDFGEEKGAELLEELGLRAASLLWAGGFTGSDGRNFRESVDDARDAIRAATLLNAPTLIVYTGARAGHTRNHARRLLRAAIDEIAPFAAEHGISLALEPMHEGCAGEWTFLTDVDETLAQLDALRHPNVQLAFDTYHLGQNPAVVERVRDIAPRTAIVQLGDARQAPRGEQNRCPLGAGAIPLREIVAQFESAGYRGFYDVELLGEDIEATDYQELIRTSVAAAAALLETNSPQ
ncbi:MAG: sugar phosphate isomerase/epimerase family protein [Pirellulales bacterium]